MYGGIEYKDADIIYARHIGNKLAVTYKLYGYKSKSQSIITEFIIFDANGNIQNRNLKIQGDQYKVHLLAEDIFVKLDLQENKVEIGIIKQSFFKHKIQYKHQTAYNEKIGIMVHAQCFEHFVFIVQQNATALIYNLFKYSGSVSGLTLVSQLTGQLHEGIKVEHIIYSSEFNHYPVVVVQQEQHFQVVNFSRKEILQFQIPEIALNVKSADNQFQRFLLQDSIKQNVFFLNGIGVIVQFDWVNDKTRMVIFTTTLNSKTTILYSNVNILLSYEMQEVQDILYLGNLFLMAGCANLPVTAAAKYVMNHIQLFINQQLNKQIIYNSIQKLHKQTQLADFIPWDFYNLLSNKTSQNSLIFELGECIITENDVIITLQRVLNRVPNLKSAPDEGKRSNSNNNTTNREEAQIKEPRIYPVLFNYTPKGTFEQQIKEIVAAFKQFNPERTEFRRSFSISGYDDSDSEHHSAQRIDWRRSIDIDKVFNINQKQKETILDQFDLIPCPSIFTTDYHILIPSSRFSQLSTSNQAYNKIMVFDFLHQQIKTVQFQINLFQLNNFNNYITEMAQLHNYFTKEAKLSNQIEQIVQKEQYNLLQMRSECLYISLAEDIILNTYWKSGLFTHNFELNQMIIPEWMNYINIVLENEMLDTRLTALLTITKTIVDTYLMISYLQIHGTKSILMQIAQNLYQIIDDNENNIILSLQKLLQDTESSSIVMKSKSVGEFFKNLTYDTTCVSNINLYTHENESVEIKQGLNLYNKNLIKQFIHNSHSYFLPDSDGELVTYNYMYQIQNLGIFNPHTTQSFYQEISQINAIPAYPPYYKKQQHRIQYFGENENVQQVIQKLQQQFYHQKALFNGMRLRNSIYSLKLNDPSNSIIYRSTHNVLLQFDEISKNFSQLSHQSVRTLSQTILDNIVQQFSINIDFLAQKIMERAKDDQVVKFDELISTIETIEILGVQAQDNCYANVVTFVKFVCQSINDIRSRHKKMNAHVLFKIDSSDSITNVVAGKTLQSQHGDEFDFTKKLETQLTTIKENNDLGDHISSVSHTNTMTTIQNDQETENIMQKTSIYDINSVLIDQLISYQVIKTF